MVREHGDYISRVDSFRSPRRPPLWRIFDRFFIKQYQSPVLSIIASLFVVVSVDRRDPRAQPLAASERADVRCRSRSSPG